MSDVCPDGLLSFCLSELRHRTSDIGFSLTSGISAKRFTIFAARLAGGFGGAGMDSPKWNDDDEA